MRFLDPPSRIRGRSGRRVFRKRVSLAAKRVAPAGPRTAGICLEPGCSVPSVSSDDRGVGCVPRPPLRQGAENASGKRRGSFVLSGDDLIASDWRTWDCLALRRPASGHKSGFAAEAGAVPQGPGPGAGNWAGPLRLDAVPIGPTLGSVCHAPLVAGSEATSELSDSRETGT